MSDGGKAESAREKTNGSKGAEQAASGEFGRAVSKVAVAQICESIGFQGFKASALEALADISIRYLSDLGRIASFYANLGSRTECNVFDIVHGLEDLGSSSGFPGASEGSNCVISMGIVKTIVEYVESAEEIPFAQPVPHFPVARYKKGIPSFVQIGETPKFKHVPNWLPAFPDPHTYIQSPVWNERATDPRADKIELVRQRRKAESSLLSLQQRLVSCGCATTSTSGVAETKKDSFLAIALTSQIRADGESKNPFLAPPVQAGELDVQPVVLPAKPSKEAVLDNHVSLLDMFAPAIEAINERVHESEDIARKVIPAKRPAVHLNFKIAKKMVGESMDLQLLNRGSGRMASWFGRDEEKDDKKRRAELILRQSMMNPQVLTQL